MNKGQHEDGKSNRITFGLIGIVILALLAYLNYGRIWSYDGSPVSYYWELGFLLGIGCSVAISVWWVSRQKLK